MRISIITPSFNQGAFIAQAVESVLAQGCSDVEHIIVDNCSTDNTASVLARYPHLKIIREKDKGQSDALNKGFKVATGDIVGWLNADDLYLPGCFAKVSAAFHRTTAADLVYGDYRLIDVGGNLICLRKELPFDMFMLKYLHILCIPSTTTFFKRRIFDDGNFLDIACHYAMDYEFFVRLALGGYRFVYTPDILADFRWHMDAKSQKQTRLQKQEMEQALVRHDPFLRAMPLPWRTGVRYGLMAAARCKRYALKLFMAKYRG